MSDATDMRSAYAPGLRDALRHFVENEVPPALLQRSRAHAVLSKDEYVTWMRLLQRHGWATGHWPAAHGGLGWSPAERFVFEDELARLGCPWVIPFGVKYVGPVLCAFGSPEQQARFLPRIAATQDWWAQGFSEPGAGSDLAALRTQARRDADHYVLDGQKTWTTYAQWADWMFCLARTGGGARPQEGISFLLVDMRTPGVTVRPIATMDGYHHVNEVWLENVRVPVEQRVGAEGAGWSCAKFLLRNERTAGAVVGNAWRALQELRALQPAGGAWRPRLGELSLRFLALEAAAYQAVRAMSDGSEHGWEASLIKMRGAELHQDIAEAVVEALGIGGVVVSPGAGGAPGLVKDHLYNRAATIFGGSSEVQRNIVARAVLGA